VLLVQRLQLVAGDVVTENPLIDGLEQQTRGNDIERRVVFDILQSDLDDRLVKLLGRDSVEEREFELARDLGDPGDVLIQSLGGVLDREVDFVRIVRLALTVTLHDSYCHCFSLLVPPQRAAKPWPDPQAMRRT
jgi:hypothetical protein